MKTIIALLLAGIGFGVLATPAAEARPVSPLAAGTDAVYVNETVIIRTGRHRRFRTVRRVYYRHGRRVVVLRRVYY